MQSPNLPNSLTVVRVLLVPVLVVALTFDDGRHDLIAAGVFFLAAFTDGLDGWLARRRGSVTSFGKVMDPIADKLLVAAALVALVGLGRVGAWVAAVVILRELAVSGLRVAAGQQGVVISASGLGKLKTAVQVVAILALISASDPGALWVQALVVAMVGVTVASGADYFMNYRRTTAAPGGAQTPLTASASASSADSRSSSSSREVPRR